MTERLEVLREDVTDCVKCVVAGCGHPLSFLHTHTQVSVSARILTSLFYKRDSQVDLGLLLRELHVVENPEDDPEQVLPPVFLVRVTVSLHHLKHHRQTPEADSQSDLKDQTTR